MLCKILSNLEKIRTVLRDFVVTWISLSLKSIMKMESEGVNMPIYLILINFLFFLLILNYFLLYKNHSAFFNYLCFLFYFSSYSLRFSMYLM
jgi:hypothetical protein